MSEPRIVVTLDVMMARRKVKGRDLAARVGISEANLSLLKQGHVKGVRFETLWRICDALDCQPGDILTFERSAASTVPPPSDSQAGEGETAADAPDDRSLAGA